MSKKIKILHLLPNLYGGGAEQVCVDILTNLDRNKFIPSILLFKDKKLLGKDKKEKLIKLNIPIFSLDKKYIIDLSNLIKIIKKIKEIKPDILHTHLGGDIYGPLASLFTKIPIIVSTEHNLNYQEKRLYNILKKVLLKRLKKVYAVSQAVKEDAIKRYNLKSNKIDVIYNGLDLNYWLNNRDDNKDLNEKQIIIGSLGRLNKQKGHLNLIKAISLIKNENFRLEIAGKGELEDELEIKIKRLQLEKKVTLVGQVNNKEWLKKIDIFVMPSLWEGLGLSILEAMIMKKPIIVSQVDGLKEIVNHKNAYLYQKNDINKLANLIKYLSQNLETQKVNQKIEKAYYTVIDKFDLNIMIKNYQKNYENLASK